MTGQKDAAKQNDQADADAPPRPISFQTLSNGRTEITIEHEGQEYRLRATKNGKLLLNK